MNSVKEIVSLHIGQAGIQLGGVCWELFCLEHGIQSDGRIAPDQPIDGDSYLINKFFHRTNAEKYIPRSVFIDLDPTAINNIRTSSYKNVFTNEQFVNGKEDTASNYACGYYKLGAEIIDVCLDKIRKAADICSDLEGFIIYNSIGGGTGSGLGALLLERLSDDYGSKLKLGFNLYPGPQIPKAFVEPYNVVLANRALNEFTDISIMFGNDSVYDIAKLNLGIPAPNYNSMNEVIAYLISDIAISLRHDSSLNKSLSEFKQNLVSYKRMNFVIPSYGYIVPQNNFAEELSTINMIESAFMPNSSLVKCNLNNGKHLMCNMMFRGDVVPKDVGIGFASIHTSRKLILEDSKISSIKLAINWKPKFVILGGNIKNPRRSLVRLSNNTIISQAFSNIGKEFDSMYSKRLFLHSYLSEGMDEKQFAESREEMEALIKSYEEIDNKVLPKEEEKEN